MAQNSEIELYIKGKKLQKVDCLNYDEFNLKTSIVQVWQPKSYLTDYLYKALPSFFWAKANCHTLGICNKHLWCLICKAYIVCELIFSTPIWGNVFNQKIQRLSTTSYMVIG